MSDVTQILSAIENGDAQAANDLLPLVYGELRRLAAHRMSDEAANNTLQATALVHEAYLRLVGPEGTSTSWNNRGHFFAAAAEAMRRILIDDARARVAQKRGGAGAREVLHDSQLVAPQDADEVIALDESLSRLEALDSVAARLVKLRFFAGLIGKEAAAILEISPRKADQLWAFARAWLRDDVGR